MVPCLVTLTDSKRVARFVSDSWVSFLYFSNEYCNKSRTRSNQTKTLVWYYDDPL